MGLIANPKQAEAIVAEGSADMVALARAFLDDPHWAWHAAQVVGRGGDPSAAISARRAGTVAGSETARVHMIDPVVVEVVRGGLVESRHRGAIAVVDSSGTKIFAAGDVGGLFSPLGGEAVSGAAARGNGRRR